MLISRTPSFRSLLGPGSLHPGTSGPCLSLCLISHLASTWQGGSTVALEQTPKA